MRGHRSLGQGERSFFRLVEARPHVYAPGALRLSADLTIVARATDQAVVTRSSCKIRAGLWQLAAAVRLGQTALLDLYQ